MKLIKVLAIGSWSFLITIVLLAISFYFKLPIIVNVLVMDAFIILIFTLLIFMIFSDPEKKKQSKKESLYNWMEELPDYDNHIFRVLESRKAKHKTIDNLKVTKRLIMSLTKKNKETLKLYKAFYSQRIKESTNELYLKTVLVILPTFGLYLLRDYLPKIHNIDINLLVLLIIFLFISIAAITDRLNYNKKRAGMLIEIIEICIEELDEKEKKVGGGR